MTELGSAPSLPRTKSASQSRAHFSSCSAAAARNVSPAARRTPEPSSVNLRATLPIDVVLPTPLTPTNNHTGTDPSDAVSDNSLSQERSSFICLFSASSNSVPVSSFSTRAVSRSLLTTSRVVSTPTSADISNSSSSSHIEGLIEPPFMPFKRPEIAVRAFDSFSRTEAAGATSCGACIVSGLGRWVFSPISVEIGSSSISSPTSTSFSEVLRVVHAR